MRTRYRSARLTSHQRGWTDAGWTVSRLQLCNGPLKMQLLLHDSSQKGTLYSTPLYSCTSLSYARGQHGLHGAWVMLSVRIADPLSGRRAGSWFGTAEKKHKLFLGWEGDREVLGWKIRGSSTCPRAADGGEKCRTIYVCISFLRAVVVAGACRLSLHFDSFCSGHLLFAYVCSTGVFSAIHVCFKWHCMRM